ncbi:hypothetical protein H6P81_006875 [Aristolochia fimbriata]|uniref:Uncharacterized protein n=1 Tax=Aristolochia fimbriata TaxID=158543 RepID=A0AAV7F1A3_ARIFI|nr:hypothetical protein H6P81_006875 [Aristolochia fimbriata]
MANAGEVKRSRKRVDGWQLPHRGLAHAFRAGKLRRLRALLQPYLFPMQLAGVVDTPQIQSSFTASASSITQFQAAAPAAAAAATKKTRSSSRLQRVRKVASAIGGIQFAS